MATGKQDDISSVPPSVATPDARRGGKPPFLICYFQNEDEKQLVIESANRKGMKGSSFLRLHGVAAAQAVQAEAAAKAAAKGGRELLVGPPR